MNSENEKNDDNNNASSSCGFEQRTNLENCRQWLENCNLSEISESESTSTGDALSITTETSTSESQLDFFHENIPTIAESTTICTNENGEIQHELTSLLNKKPSHYESIQTYKSKKVHIGDITRISGNVIINNYGPTLNQAIVTHQTIVAPATEPPPISIVSRLTWLAQPPVDPDDIKLFNGPPKFVIISHSASEEGRTQTENNLNVRLIQQFHVESRKWNDIGYNFLIGADGSIYEGRGWDVVGAHTFRYNKIALGICFVGYYVRNLPPDVAIRNAKSLIQHGVKLGKISKDYKLLAHRQCVSTESPGERLFAEVQTWENWDDSINIDSPSPLINHGVL